MRRHAAEIRWLGGEENMTRVFEGDGSGFCVFVNYVVIRRYSECLWMKKVCRRGLA